MKVAASMSVGRLAPKHSLDIDGIRAISPNVTPSLIKDDIVFIDRLRRPDGSHDDLGGEYYSPDTTPERKAQLRAEYEGVYRQWVTNLERDFPHMTLVFAVAHFSETEWTPHLHVCMQPQADCTRGLAKQVSIGRALAQDGIERLDSREEAKQAGGYQLARFYQRFHHEYQNPSLQRLGYEIKAEQHGLKHMEKDGYAVVMEQADKIVQESRERAEITEKARKAAQKDLDLLETKQLMVELEVDEATQTAEAARQAAQRAIQQKAEAEASKAAIQAQARYEAETTVRELQAQLMEKESIIHGLKAEVARFKEKLSRVRLYLQENCILENYFSWVRGRSQQQSQDYREQ